MRAREFILMLVGISLVVIFQDAAVAASAGAGNSFADKGLKWIIASFTGSTARYLGGAALIGGLLVFFFGGEMSDIVKKFAFIAIVVGALINVSAIVQGMFGSGAVAVIEEIVIVGVVSESSCGLVPLDGSSISLHKDFRT